MSHETRFANRTALCDPTFRTTMRLATASLILACAAATCLPYLLPAASLDSALAAAGLPAGPLARSVALAYVPALACAAAAGLRLRLDGAAAPQSLVPCWFAAAAVLLGACARLLPQGEPLARLVDSSSAGLVAMTVWGLGLVSLCIPAGPNEPAAEPDMASAPAPARPVAAYRAGTPGGDAPVEVALAA